MDTGRVNRKVTRERIDRGDRDALVRVFTEVRAFVEVGLGKLDCFGERSAV